jgi:hypothetical protein
MQTTTVITDWPIKAFWQLVVKLEQLFRGNYALPVLIIRCIYTKSGLLPYFTIVFLWGYPIRSQNFRNKRDFKWNDDHCHDEDNYRKQLLSHTHIWHSLLHIHYLWHLQHCGRLYIVAPLTEECMEAQGGDGTCSKNIVYKLWIYHLRPTFPNYKRTGSFYFKDSITLVSSFTREEWEGQRS